MKAKKSSPISIRTLNILETLSSMSILLVIQRNLSIVLPIIMVGAFGLMIRHFPFPGLTFFLDEKFGQEWQILFDNIISGTLGIVSLAVLCTFSGVMAMAFNIVRSIVDQC